MSGKSDVLERVVALEAALARARKVGRAALVVGALGLVTAGIAVGWQWMPRKTVRASRFELVSRGGDVRGTWTADAHGSTFVLLSPEGQTRLALRSAAHHGEVELGGLGEGLASLRLLATKGMSSIELRDGKERRKGRGSIRLLASGEGGGSAIEMSQSKGKEYRSVRLSSGMTDAGLRVGSICGDSDRSASASLDLLSGEGRLRLIGPAFDGTDKTRPIPRSAALSPGGLTLWRRDGGQKTFELGPPPR